MAHEDEAGQGLHGSASMWKFDGSAWDDEKTSCSDDEA